MIPRKSQKRQIRQVNLAAGISADKALHEAETKRDGVKRTEEFLGSITETKMGGHLSRPFRVAFGKKLRVYLLAALHCSETTNTGE